MEQARRIRSGPKLPTPAEVVATIYPGTVDWAKGRTVYISVT